MPARRSQIAFMRGAWTAARRILVPLAWNTASNEAVKSGPRSRIRNLLSSNRSSRMRARLRACCAVHSPVGLAVTPPKCRQSSIRAEQGSPLNGLALNVPTRTKCDIYHHMHRVSPGHHVTRVSPRPQSKDIGFTATAPGGRWAARNPTRPVAALVSHNENDQSPAPSAQGYTGAEWSPRLHSRSVLVLQRDFVIFMVGGLAAGSGRF